MDNANSPNPIECGTYEESEAAPVGISEEPMTSSPQEAVNPSQKVVKVIPVKALSKREMCSDQTLSNKVQTRKCLVFKQSCLITKHFPFEQGLMISFPWEINIALL